MIERRSGSTRRGPATPGYRLADGSDQAQTPDQAPRQRRGRGRVARAHRAQADGGREERQRQRGTRAPSSDRTRARHRPPTWRGAFFRAMFAAVLMLAILLVFCSTQARPGGRLFPIVLLVLHPDQLLHRPVDRTSAASAAQQGRRRRGAPRRQRDERARRRSFTVGPVQENCYIVRADAGAATRRDRRPRRRARAAAGRDRARSACASRRSSSRTVTSTTSARSRRSRAPPARPCTARRSSARCSPTSCAGSPPGLRTVRELRARAHASPAASADARRPGHRRAVHARPQPRPHHVRSLRRPTARDALGRRACFRARSGRVDLPGGDWATLERSIAA